MSWSEIQSPLEPTSLKAYVVDERQGLRLGSRPGVAVAKRLLLEGAPQALMVVGATLGVTLGGAGLAWALTGAPTPPASLLIAGQNAAAKASEQEGKARQVQLDHAQRSGPVLHEVKEGESFQSLAARYRISARTLRLANLMDRNGLLAPGTKLTVPPVEGLAHPVKAPLSLAQLAARYGVSAGALQALNPTLGAELKPGDRVFVPGATALVAEQAAPAPAAPAAPLAQRTPVRAAAAPAPVNPRGYRPRDRQSRLIASRSLIGQFGGRVGSLLWPASGQLSSPFGLRGAGFHPGMDICNAVGTPIHAAKPGTVLSAGWMGGYGNAVDIDHGNGVITRYGHCSALLVRAGQSVQGGERIALMGSTGYSTGPHVHFEVRIQGRPVNPATFF